MRKIVCFGLMIAVLTVGIWLIFFNGDNYSPIDSAFAAVQAEGTTACTAASSDALCRSLQQEAQRLLKPRVVKTVAVSASYTLTPVPQQPEPDDTLGPLTPKAAIPPPKPIL